MKLHNSSNLLNKLKVKKQGDIKGRLPLKLTTSIKQQKCSIKKGVLKSFSKFPGKHLSRLKACELIKKETLAQVYSCEF